MGYGGARGKEGGTTDTSFLPFYLNSGFRGRPLLFSKALLQHNGYNLLKGEASLHAPS